MCSGLPAKCSIFFVILQLNLEFLGRFSLKFPISSFKEISPLGVMLLYADRWMDMMKLTATLYNYVNAPNDIQCGTQS
jgi:hypothetical protein